MINFYDLRSPYMSIFLTVLFLTLCAGAVCLFFVFKRKNIGLGIVLLLAFATNLAILTLYASNTRAALFQLELPDIVVSFSNLPLAFTFAILALILFVETIAFIQEQRFQKTAITHASIKESLDHLNTGLCFSKPNGMVLLINHRMVSLGFSIIGEDIQNMSRFWKTLQSGTVRDDVKRLSSGETPEFLLPDGTIWTFRKEVLNSAVQLTAADTTELHRLMDQLRDENRNLEIMYQRIRDYGDKVDQYVIAKERLETRVNLHSFLGQALLTTRHYLQYHNGDPAKIFEMWQRNIDVLKLEAEPQHETDSFSELKSNAKVVGITVTTNGVIPSDPEVKRLFASAGVEAVINAGKHAEAKNVQINISENEHEYIAQYTNDGRIPSSGVVEGGGLSTLRTKIERAGGKMAVCSAPGYVLTIILEKERVHND